MRSNSITKMPKPPPPIPPRPSKALVAEALAKTRKSPTTNGTDSSTPIRNAPPPPNPLAKSQSYSNVFFCKQKNNNENTENSRTVVFQSSNLNKSSPLMRHESDRLRRNVWNNNYVNNSSEVIKPNETKSELIIENDRVNNQKTTLDSQWNDVLIGKNHVNTLIDEMFASILDSSDDQIELNETFNEHVNGVTLDDTEESIDPGDANADEDNGQVTASTPECDSDQHISTTVLILDDKSDTSKSNSSTSERSEKRVKFDDFKNHELLISELQSMRKEQDIYEEIGDDLPKIQRSDWVEVNNGQEVRLSRCQIIIENDDSKKCDTKGNPILSRLNMSSLHGLPPLPKSLSGFSLLDNQRNSQTPNRATPTRSVATPSTPNFGSGRNLYSGHSGSFNGTISDSSNSGRTATNLDNQLAILRREMVSF